MGPFQSSSPARFALLAIAVSRTAVALAGVPATAPEPKLIHLPGIAGEMRIDHELVSGLIAGGVTDDAVIFDWTGVDRGVPALTNVQRHHQQSARLADAIITAGKHSPGRSIILVAHSAGTGVAVEALEQLPAGVNVQTLVLLASALSPDYDLSPALAHVTGRAYSLFSRYDNLVLGVGTRAFGTYDRVRTDAAGYVGFRQPPRAVAAAYAKLTQIPYDAAWTRLGNGGDHIGATSRRFARTILAPVIEGRPMPTTWPSSPPAVPAGVTP